MLYELWNSSGPQYKHDKAWIMRLVANGLAAEEDIVLWRRRHVLELILALLGSGHSDQESRRQAIDAITRAASFPKIARTLLSSGLTAWLHTAVISPTSGSTLLGLPHSLPYLLRSMARSLLPALASLVRDATVGPEWVCDLALLTSTLLRLGLCYHNADERAEAQGLVGAVLFFTKRALPLLVGYEEAELVMPIEDLVELTAMCPDIAAEPVRARLILNIVTASAPPLSSHCNDNETNLAGKLARWALKATSVLLRLGSSSSPNMLVHALARWLTRLMTAQPGVVALLARNHPRWGAKLTLLYRWVTAPDALASLNSAALLIFCRAASALKASSPYHHILHNVLPLLVPHMPTAHIHEPPQGSQVLLESEKMDTSTMSQDEDEEEDGKSLGEFTSQALAALLSDFFAKQPVPVQLMALLGNITTTNDNKHQPSASSDEVPKTITALAGRVEQQLRRHCE